ncbi:MAG: hypothetical protein QM718_11260 [Steroidobacteraceae bacterium]
MSEARCLVEFLDAQRVVAGVSPDRVLLRGHEASPGHPVVDLYFNGANGAPLPLSWKQMKVMQVASPAGEHFWRLVAAGSDQPVHAHSVQVHRDASARMFAALPRVQAPLRLRVFWWLLPRLLRMPGVALLLKRRSAS